MDQDRSGDEPCFAHKLIAGQPVDPDTARDVARFRKAKRAEMYAARKALRSDDRARLTAAIESQLDRAVPDPAGLCIGVYWPIRGEPDLRGWMGRAHHKGAKVCLPVVVGRDQPLEFRPWHPGCPMTRGDWNIPVPAEGAAVRPDLVVSPLVGVDDANFRLGNGGGYYDRTLAAMIPKPRMIGIGFPACRIKTIHPMPWDIPMDEVILGV